MALFGGNGSKYKPKPGIIPLEEAIEHFAEKKIYFQFGSEILPGVIRRESDNFVFHYQTADNICSVSTGEPNQTLKVDLKEIMRKVEDKNGETHYEKGIEEVYAFEPVSPFSTRCCPPEERDKKTPNKQYEELSELLFKYKIDMTTHF